VVNVIATLLLKDRCHHTDSTRQVFAIALLRRREVVLLLLWAFVSMFGYITLLFSLSDFALAIGLSQQHATDIVGFLNIGTAIGRPIIGVVSDQFSRVVTAGMLTFLCGVICFALWLPASSFALVAVFAVLCGAILGVFWMVSGIRMRGFHGALSLCC
jgi:predicted MFS family arabinose efflux permease